MHILYNVNTMTFENLNRRATVIVNIKSSYLMINDSKIHNAFYLHLRGRDEQWKDWFPDFDVSLVLKILWDVEGARKKK